MSAFMDHISDTETARGMEGGLLVRSFIRYRIASFTVERLSSAERSSHESYTLVRMVRMTS